MYNKAYVQSILLRQGSGRWQVRARSLVYTGAWFSEPDGEPNPCLLGTVELHKLCEGWEAAAILQGVEAILHEADAVIVWCAPIAENEHVLAIVALAGTDKEQTVLVLLREQGGRREGDYVCVRGRIRRGGNQLSSKEGCTMVSRSLSACFLDELVWNHGWLRSCGEGPCKTGSWRGPSRLPLCGAAAAVARTGVMRSGSYPCFASTSSDGGGGGSRDDISICDA